MKVNKKDLAIAKFHYATPAVNRLESASHRQLVLASSAVLPRILPSIHFRLAQFIGKYCDFPGKVVRWCLRKTKKTSHMRSLFVYPSNALLSQAAARQVSSAPQSLTTVFGMGTGVSSASLSLSSLNTIHLNIFTINFPILFGQALGLFVSVSLIHYCSYTSDLSTT